jgi:uncharacterized repeat protein (TIGR01451 family)
MPSSGFRQLWQLFHLHRRIAASSLALLVLSGSQTGLESLFEKQTAEAQSGTLNLQISKTTNQTTVQRNGLITYQITVRNNGTINVPNMRIRDGIPLQLSYVSANSTDCSMVSLGINRVICGPFSLNAGQSRTFSLTFRVDANAICGGTIVNRAHLVIGTVDFSEAYALSTINCPNTSSSSSSSSSYSSSSSSRSSSSSSYSSYSSSSYPSSTSSSSSYSYSYPSSYSSSYYSSSSSYVGTTGCINVLKEAFGPYGQRLTVVPQFTFKLDGNQSGVNDSSGYLQFGNVSTGWHTVTEVVPDGWTQFLVTPENGQVYVSAGGSCAGVIFKNQQNLPASSSSYSSSSYSSSIGYGCIDVLKEAFDPTGQELTVVPQFQFKLDGNQTVLTDTNGRATFYQVPEGTHTVTEMVPAGWNQFLVTPANGTVYVYPGNSCAGVTFKNQQYPPSSSSSSSSYSSYSSYSSSSYSSSYSSSSSSSSSSSNPGITNQSVTIDSTASTNVNVDISGQSGNNVVIEQDADDEQTNQDADVDIDAETDIDASIDAESMNDISVQQDADDGQVNQGVEIDADDDVDIDAMIDALTENDIDIQQTVDDAMNAAGLSTESEEAENQEQEDEDMDTSSNIDAEASAEASVTIDEEESSDSTETPSPLSAAFTIIQALLPAALFGSRKFLFA